MNSLLKSIALLCVVITSLVSFVFADDVPQIPTNKSKFLVFLLMGQSNMEGLRATADPSEMDKESDPRILKMRINGDWAVAEDPISNYEDLAVGPGMSFAKRIIAEYPDVTVGLVPLAKGGTNLFYWSKPGLKYDEMLWAINKVRDSGGTLAGILWHQGEHDAFEHLYGTYQLRLETLVDTIRRDVGDVKLPFIIGGFPDSKELLGKNAFRGYIWRRLFRVGHNFFRCAYANSVGVPYRLDDQLHFNAEGQRIMGEHYAQAYLNLVGYWTEKGKEWLDENAVVDESGWKYNSELGVYWDEHWPIIKHAQLGWLKVNIDENRVIRLDSPFIGKYTVVQNDSWVNAIYIQTEDICHDDWSDYPEYTVWGDWIWVNLLAEPGDLSAFYDHGTNSHLSLLPGMTLISDERDLNSLVEAEFAQTQTTSQYLANVIAADNGYWSDMRKYVDDESGYRDYTNYIGWEGYYYAKDNLSGQFREFWMNKFLERLHDIDVILGNDQDLYENETNALLFPFGN